MTNINIFKKLVGELYKKESYVYRFPPVRIEISVLYFLTSNTFAFNGLEIIHEYELSKKLSTNTQNLLHDINKDTFYYDSFEEVVKSVVQKIEDILLRDQFYADEPFFKV